MARSIGSRTSVYEEFKIRRCRRFVAAEGAAKIGYDCMCQCGYKRSEHLGKALQIGEQTLKAEGGTSPSVRTSGGEEKGTTGPDSSCAEQCDSEFLKTDAYGEINFGGINPCLSKYIRLDKDTDMDQVLHLFRNAWGLRRPKLLISVTGSAVECNMDKDLKRNFRRGLLKAAASTGAWITSGGTWSGVMKHVGKAALEYTEAYGIQEDLVVLGVATWGCVTNRETLRNSVPSRQRSQIVYYEVEGTEGKEECSLDPNHTHFLLVDDGTYNKYGGEIIFRTRLEAKLSEGSGYSRKGTIRNRLDRSVDSAHDPDSGDKEPVPVVCVALEGGRGTLHTIKSSLEQNIPVVVFKAITSDAISRGLKTLMNMEHDSVMEDFQFTIAGSGRVADIVAEAVSGDRDQTTLDSELKKLLGEADLTEHKQWLKECLMRKDLLTVYDIQKDINLDEAILTAILKMSKYSTVKKIQMAQEWNRTDMTIKFIKMSPGVKEHRNDYVSIFLKALQDNQVDLVKRFLHTGVNLEDSLSGKNKDMTLKVVGSLLKKLDRDVRHNRNKVQPTKLRDIDKGFDVSQRLVFFWCVVTGKKGLALLFWDTAKEGLVLALIAQRLLQRLRAIEDDSEEQKQLQENEKFFADFAVAFLNFLYKQDQDRCRNLVVRESGILERKTALDFAYECNNRSFVAHPVCQGVLNDMWRGEISRETSLFRIMLAVVVPFVAGLILKREQKAQVPDDDGDDMDEPTRRKNLQGSRLTVPPSGRCYYSCLHVYQAPLVKLILNTVSFLAFLVLFSFSLCCFFDHMFHWYDGVLIVWVTSMFFEELRQLVTIEGERVIIKLKHYICDFWNILDISAVILYATALVLRFLPSSSCPHCLLAARIIGAFGGVCYFLRFLDIFSVNELLGPKVLMLGQMMKELGGYVLILLVLVCGFGVVSQALLFPNSPPDGSLLKNILRRPYFHIYGELFFDEVEYTNCQAGNFSQGERCPDRAGSYVVLGLLAVYILFTNVLVLNLIIAMFSFTVTKIHENNNKYWRMQRYHVIKEFNNRPVLPPPFILFPHIASLVSTIFGYGPQKYDGYLSSEEEKALLSWETLQAYDFINQCEKIGQRKRMAEFVENEFGAPEGETETYSRISQRISNVLKISR